MTTPQIDAELTEARALFLEAATEADPLAATIWQRRVDGARWDAIAAEVNLSVDETQRRVRFLVDAFRTALEASPDPRIETSCSRNRPPERSR